MGSSENENMEFLIQKYLENKASEHEVRELAHWIGLSDENKKYYQQVKNIWELSDPANTAIKVDVSQAFGSVLNRLEKKRENKKWIVVMQKIAAVLLLPMVVSGYFLGRNMELRKAGASVTFNEIYATLGTRSKVVLSDGTVVWLNSGSKLRYPDKFTEKERNVYLSGEAFFVVKSDETRPFTVQTKEVNVKATGTSFNVQAVDNDPEVNVSLLSGKVLVKSLNTEETVRMEPNQRVSINRNTGNVDTFTGDLYEFIAWKDGRLVFRNKPLSEVVKKISQYYNVDIELRGKELQDYRYRATFEEESLNEILKLLRLSSPIKYAESERVLLPNGTFTKRKIIISPL